MWTLTTRAVATEPEPCSIDHAVVWGLALNTATEHPHHYTGTLDLSPEAPLAELPAVLANSGHHDQIALRSSGLRTRSLTRAQPTSEPTWTPRDTVLITGGTGALGSHAARWCAANGAEHLVLTNRDPRTPRAQQLKDELETTWATTVTLLACDLTDPADLEALGDHLDALRTPLRAVLHTAGTTHTDPLAELTPRTAQQVVSAEARTAVNLHHLTRHHPLDQFASYGSIAAAWTSGAQSAYTAANTALNAPAHTRNHHQLPTTTLNWAPGTGRGWPTALRTSWRAAGTALSIRSSRSPP